MRVKLKHGKQSELIEKAKKQRRFSNAELAKELRISKRHLSSWKTGKTQTIPSSSYRKLCRLAKQNFDGSILQFLNDSWAANAASAGRQLKVEHPSKSEKLAEFVGIHLGDGNIYVKDKLVYQLRISGNLKDEKRYMLCYVKPLLKDLFGVNPKVKVLNNNCIHVCINSKPLCEFLRSIGLKPGNKVEKNIGIPAWIFEHNNYVRACLKGLIDTDGSVHRLSNKDPHLVRICFKNLNKRLIHDVRKALMQVGFHPSKITNNNIFLTRKAEVRYYAEKIRFNNYKHITRFAKFSPVV